MLQRLRKRHKNRLAGFQWMIGLSVLSMVGATGGCHHPNRDRDVHYQAASGAMEWSKYSADAHGLRVKSTSQHVTGSSSGVLPGQSSSIPAYHLPTPGIGVERTTFKNAQVVVDDLIAAWDVFGDPRLRSIHELALVNQPNAREIQKRFIEARLPEAAAIPSDLNGSRHLLMIQLARRVCLLRHHGHCLQTLGQQLERQRDALHQARIRYEVGTVGQGDLDRLLDRIHETEAMFPIEARKRDLVVAEIQPLIGQRLTAAMTEAIADQPALTLPGTRHYIEAKRLLARCDVEAATRRVGRLAHRSGIAEAELLPQLALRGVIRTEWGPTYRASDRHKLSLGDLRDWDFVAPEGFLSPTQNASSPLHQAMTTYQQTVTTAAGEVKQLLTNYLRHRTHVKELNRLKTQATKVLHQTRAEFEVDLASAEDLVNSQRRSLEIEMEVHQADHEFAQAAIDLFLSLGGPCHSTSPRISQARYFEDSTQRY